MTNPYFDISAPNNNKVWNYDLWVINHERFLAKMRPKDLYKLIPFTFNTTFVHTELAPHIKLFIKDCLSDKTNHKYLTTRTKYKETPKSETKRNNIIHALLSTYMNTVYEGDAELMKEIITCAFQAGINPMECSIREGLSPVGVFMRQNAFRDYGEKEKIIPEEIDFFQFLMDFHPQSLVALSEDNKCALALLLGECPRYNEALLFRCNMVIRNLQREGIQENIRWLEHEDQTKKTDFVRFFQPVLEELRARSDKLMLNDGLEPMVGEKTQTNMLHKI